jgi:hypothetical protein
VVIVGARTATTPATIDLPKDDYTVVFRKPGYREVTLDLRRQMSAWFFGSLVMGVIASGVDLITGAWKEFESTALHAILEPLPDVPEPDEEIEVAVKSEPPGAEIVADGAARGRTPAKVRLIWKPRELEKTIRLRLEGYYEKGLPLGRESARLEAALEPRPVTVRVSFVSTPPGAEVRVDGAVAGRTPVVAPFDWVPGSRPRAVEMTLPGYHPGKGTIVQASAEVAMDLREVVETVPLRLTVTPPGAWVEADGAGAGAAPIAVPLRWSVSLRQHTLRVSHPGYASRTVVVTRDEAAGPLEVRLSPALPRP